MQEVNRYVYVHLFYQKRVSPKRKLRLEDNATVDSESSTTDRQKHTNRENPPTYSLNWAITWKLRILDFQWIGSWKLKWTNDQQCRLIKLQLVNWPGCKDRIIPYVINLLAVHYYTWMYWSIPIVVKLISAHILYRLWHKYTMWLILTDSALVIPRTGLCSLVEIN